MRKATELVIVASLLAALFLVCSPSCGDSTDYSGVRQELKRSQAERERAEEQRRAAERELAAEREKAQCRQDDLTAAAVIAFSCGLAVLVLSLLLARERRARRALLRLLEILKERWRNGKSG